MGGKHPSDFTVQFWDADGSNVTRTMAICDNAIVARAAYDEAVRQYPGERITLRHGARVIAEHEQA
jgi:hypothetical protein